MDRLALNQGKKKWLKHQLDFQLKKRLEQRIDWLYSKNQKLLKQLLDFLIKDKIEIMDRLAIIEEPKMVETTDRFSSGRKELNY